MAQTESNAEFSVLLKQVADAFAREHQLQSRQVFAALELLEEGSTVPFLARYRKEVTGGLDEVLLRKLEDALESAKALAARKRAVLKTLQSQDVLDDTLRKQIESCNHIHDLEAIYLPFKPKRRTRATVARERGLEPLAELLFHQQRQGSSKAKILQPFIDAKREVPDAAAALSGALDIVAERWSEDASTRQQLFDDALQYGSVTSKLKRGKQDVEGKFESYVNHCEPAKRIPSHRWLAMMRGESEGVLRVQLEMNDDVVLRNLRSRLLTNPQFEFHRELRDAISDCWQRLLQPATQAALFQMLKDRANLEAIDVFAKNLRELLLTPPAGPRVTLGIDPGFRTGCKIAVVDGTGKFLANTTIYPTPPKSDIRGATQTLLGLIKKYQVELIAIGNGTASRETDAFVGDLLRENKLGVDKVVVSESGASIYSASEIAGEEFPDLDVTVRGAISIARRLQDPLAELVKTDPKSIGVGQYQHDVNQKQLRKCLDRVVESCVNHVGVDVNIASESLLSHVAGIGPKLAANIVDHRNKYGSFKNREELRKVPKLGQKAFEQSAGFLRIRDGNIPLDGSAVHPDCYPIVTRMAKRLGTQAKSLVGNASLSEQLDPNEFVDAEYGLPTITDILEELAKPGRDPRREFRAVRFDEKVNKIEDLSAGQRMEGVVTNVTHFGAFVDLGVHQDGLIHISQLSDSFVEDPNSIVSVGDIVQVKVLEVDIPRKRISLTRKF